MQPKAKAQLERLNREADNIGSWSGTNIQNINFLYEAADQCRVEGYKQYQNTNLTAAYVLLLRFAKFFDLIKAQPGLQTASAAHKKCKRDLLNALTLMEEIKAKLIVQFGVCCPCVCNCPRL